MSTSQLTPAELLLSAIIAGTARWENLAPGGGEVCINGLRYFCNTDSNGLPLIGGHVCQRLFDDLENRKATR